MKKTFNGSIAIAVLACMVPIIGSAYDAGHRVERSKTSKDVVPLSKEDAVREAVFRYQFEHNSSGQQQKAGVFFLSVGKDTDPSKALLARFEGHAPPVEKVSDSTPKGGGIVDKKTGKQGVIFKVTSIKWINETEAEVEGGYYEGNLSASGNVYQVIYEKENWVVKKDTMKWISD